MPRPAADTKVSKQNAYVRQRRDDESTLVSVDGNICLTSETDQKILSEEEYHVNEPRKFIVENLIQDSNVKAKNQRRYDLEDSKCDMRTFENNSAVDLRRLAAETKVSNTNTYDRQKRDIECTHDSDCLKTCLRKSDD
jgi:hypothetical protein